MGRLSKTVIVIVVGVLVVGVAAFGGVIWYFTRPAPEGASASENQSVVYDAGDYVTNLADHSLRRFVSVHIKLEVSDSQVAEELDRREVVVRDRVLGILRSYTYDELAGNEGMTMVGREIVSSLNRLLQTGRILNIYFSQFIVQ